MKNISIIILFLLAFNCVIVDAKVIQQSGDMVLSEQLSGVSSNSISLPVVLNYKAGIKLNQRASWTGLGFYLDMPYIERIAIGCADEKSFLTPDHADPVTNHYCFPDGIFDLNKLWDRLLKPDGSGNGYQGEYLIEMTCAGTDAADGYFTDIPSQYLHPTLTDPSKPDDYYTSKKIMVINGEIDYCLADQNGQECFWRDGPIGSTTRPDGIYPANTLKNWLGLSCASGSKTINGIKKRSDFKYTDQQDVFILNAPFASGRIVFASPQVQWVTTTSRVFPVYSATSQMTPFLQNYQNLKIEINYDIPSGGGDPDISNWTITDENGIKYIFSQKIVRYNTSDPSNLNALTLGTVNAHYKNGDLEQMKFTNYGSGYFPTYPAEERATYPNKSYVMRWYLTSIAAPNFKVVDSKPQGDWITIAYEPEPTANKIKLRDLYYSSLLPSTRTNSSSRTNWPLVGISKTKINNDNYITAIYSAEAYCKDQIYPKYIASPFEQIEFQRSISLDTNDKGNQKLDAILHKINIDGTYQLDKKIKFYYDTKGLAIGHPYSKTSATSGLLKLNEVRMEDRFGNQVPHMKFFYNSNPVYPGIDNHDFFGYYSSLSLSALKNPFLSDEGHSTSDASAWSINRIVYANGLMDEYEYEPNEIQAFSTNEDFPIIHGPGVRVKNEVVFSGMGDKTKTSFGYGKGYTEYNMALASFLKGPVPENYLGEMYLLLNYRKFYYNVKNVLLLSGNSVSYDWCETYVKGKGFEKTYFLSPDDDLREYNGTRDVPLCDGKYGKSPKGCFRGAIKRIELYKESNHQKPVYSKILTYAISHDKYFYVIPALDIQSNPSPCIDITTGSGGGVGIPGDAPSFPANDDLRYLNDTTFVGVLRNIATDEIKDGVVSTVNYEYDEVSGKIKKMKTCNSDQTCIETENIFAPAIPVYLWLGGQNRYTALAGTKTWASSLLHNNGSTEVVKASASTWSQTNSGFNDGGYEWKVNTEQSGFPTTSFTGFDYSSKTGTNWIQKDKITKTDAYQRVLESEGSGTKQLKSIIYRNDIGLPMATINNGRYDNCAIFTCDYDRNDPSQTSYFDFDNKWEKGLMSGAGHASEVTSAKKHFGLKCIHVKNTFGPTRNIPIDLNKCYTASAWVFPVSTPTITKYIRFAVEIRDQDNNIHGFKDFVKENPILDKWQKIEFSFNLSDIPNSKIDGAGDYFRIWIGNNEPETYYDGLGYARPEFFVDDIRFYPTDANVSSIYYDPFVSKTVSVADANSNVLKIVSYDGLGRVSRAFKKNPDATETNSQTKVYSIANNLGSDEIKLLFPVGGEILKNAVPTIIKWIAGDNISAVDILISADNGTTWNNIAANVAKAGNNSWGNYTWIVSASTGSQFKIKVLQNGGTIESVSPSAFSIVNPDPSIPSSPSVTWPTTQPLRPVLTWSRTGSGTVTYDILFGGISPPPIKISSALSSPSFSLPNDLISNNTYYWQVIAHNANDTTIGPVWNFASPTGGMPYAVLSEPPDQTICGLVPTGVALSWTGDAGNYEIFYWKDGQSEPGTAQTTTTQTSLTVSGLDNMAWYNWEIKANRTGYASFTTEPWRFRTSVSGTPSTPYNLSGTKNSDYSATLQWEGGDDPNGDYVYYKIYLYVELPQVTAGGDAVYRTGVDKNEACDCRGECQYHKIYKDILQSYKWSSTYMKEIKGVQFKDARSCYLVIPWYQKNITLPGISSIAKIYFYVQAINYCSKATSSESGLYNFK